MKQHWHKDAVFYGINVKSFQDSNGDGIGDFQGLISRLDYLADLGVSCLWLLPFYPSPDEDNGYDVTDYCGIDPRLGTLDDFQQFAREAKQRGLKIMVDLVANHSSIEHPWFLQARQDKNSPYRDYYFWSEQEPPPYHGDVSEVAFPGVDPSIWSYDETAGAYYWHFFYNFQPDLNHHNPQVREEFHKILAFWLDLGVDGFRIDAAPHLIARDGLPGEKGMRDHNILKAMREVVEQHNPDAILMAETDTPPEELAHYFGDGDEMNLLLNFYLNNFLYLCFARGDTRYLHKTLEKFPEIPKNGEWLNFLRNLDEVNLARLSDEERVDVFRAYAPDENMRVYGRGIRRRLASMFDGDIARLKMAYSMLFALPGVPLIVYGDEIGMGDHLNLVERSSVRTPMQWANEPNAGFSTAPAGALHWPVIDFGAFGYQHINVADQQRDPNSLLNWMKQLISVRKAHILIGSAHWDLVETGINAVLAICYEDDNERLIVIQSVSEQPCKVRLELDAEILKELHDCFADREYPPLTQTEFEISPFGYRWLTSA